jgi:cytochrome c553
VNYALCCAGFALLVGQGWAGNLAPVAIYTGFENEPPKQVLDAIRNEVDSLMAPLKLPIEWRNLATREFDNPAIQVAVVTFKGACDARDAAFYRGGTGPLAWTHISEGVVLPFAEVDCGRIHELMDHSLSRVAPGRREAAFARGIGRVVTHELYHVLTASKHHGHDDVAHSAYTPQELMEDHFEFGMEELTTLRRSLTPVLRSLRLSVGVPLQSAQAGRELFESGRCSTCHGEQGEGKGAAPALRPGDQAIDPKAFAAKLGKAFGRMNAKWANQKIAPPPLNDDDIGDIVSYLNSLERR